MERLRRLHWNERTVPPERARRLTGIRKRIPNQDSAEAFVEPVTKSGAHIMGIPACYTDSFGNDYYAEQTYSALANQTREQWQIRVEGQLCNTGMQLNVTDYDTLREFITAELGDWKPQEDERHEQQ